MSNVWVRMSMISNLSTQGTTKKTPGPRAPPARRRPILKMTARSNSWTTWRPIRGKDYDQ